MIIGTSRCVTLMSIIIFGGKIMQMIFFFKILENVVTVKKNLNSTIK